MICKRKSGILKSGSSCLKKYGAGFSGGVNQLTSLAHGALNRANLCSRLLSAVVGMAMMPIQQDMRPSDQGEPEDQWHNHRREQKEKGLFPQVFKHSVDDSCPALQLENKVILIDGHPSCHMGLSH